jgi:DNA polymerase elongation subunit (family B)
MLLDVFQDDKTLQVSYWGEDGKTHIKVFNIPEREQYLWLTAPKSKGDEKSTTMKNWNGQPVYKHKIDWKKEKLNRYRLYEILDSYDEEIKNEIFSYNLPEMFFIDIENKLQDGKPNPEKPNKPVTVIGICCPNDTVMVLSGGYNLTSKEISGIQKRIDEHFSQVNRHFKFVFKYFEREYDMLHFFFKVLVPKMALMTGWNFEDYDWRYLYNRAKNLDIDVTMSSPSRKMTGQYDRPQHVGLVDYLKAYKKWTWNTNENYKLDTIGEKICGIKKVQHAESLDDMLENNFEKYVYYNAIDCCLVKLIHEKCNALTCGLTTAWMGGIKAMDCFSTTYIPENLLRSRFHAENKVLAVDPNPKKKSEGEKYAGAFVKQPVPGLHKYCTCNDYSSLYPSIMRQFNIGPETLVKMLPEDDEQLKQEWRDKGYIVCASGAVYEKEDGNLKKIITDLYFKRKSYKKTSFKYTQNMYDLKDMLHNGASDEEINDYLVKNGLDNIE